MPNIFDVLVLPAQRGDAFWIEYGSRDHPHRILIDGGITRTGREHLIQMVSGLAGTTHFELLVVSHIDLDHILGVIAFLKDLPVGTVVDEVWFNGWDQLAASGLQPFGIKEGIALCDLLEAHHAPAWNRSAIGKAIALDDADRPVSYPLPGGMRVTVLSPSLSKLAALREKWQSVLQEFAVGCEDESATDDRDALEIEGLQLFGADDIDVASLAKNRFTEDDTIANGSSIALVLEYASKRAIMLADAHPSLIVKSLKHLSPTKRYVADLVKVSHHGSKYNTNRGLVRQIKAPKWILSSNGASTKHPNLESVARLLHGSSKPKLIFNYKTKYNDAWDNDSLKQKYRYETVYGDGKSPVVIHL